MKEKGISSCIFSLAKRTFARGPHQTAPRFPLARISSHDCAWTSRWQRVMTPPRVTPRDSSWLFFRSLGERKTWTISGWGVCQEKEVGHGVRRQGEWLLLATLKIWHKLFLSNTYRVLSACCIPDTRFVWIMLLVTIHSSLALVPITPMEMALFWVTSLASYLLLSGNKYN